MSGLVIVIGSLYDGVIVAQAYNLPDDSDTFRRELETLINTDGIRRIEIISPDG